MELTGRIARQMLLLSLLVLVGPMILFPEKLGLGLAKASLVNAVLEIIYYTGITILTIRNITVMRTFQVAGLCLVYRLLLGTMFGLLIAAVYNLNIYAALTLGLSSYLPAVLLHVAITPIVLRPLALQLLPRPTRVRPSSMPPTPGTESVLPDLAGDASATALGAISGTVDLSPSAGSGGAAGLQSSGLPHLLDPNGFDRVARHIGEDGSVQAALVVDQEGLVLGRFTRRQIDGEVWAPLALLLVSATGGILGKADHGNPDKLDVLFDQCRLIVAHEQWWWLLVVAERQASEVLNIRINQGQEMIRTFVAQRYDRLLSPREETTHAARAQ